MIKKNMIFVIMFLIGIASVSATTFMESGTQNWGVVFEEKWNVTHNLDGTLKALNQTITINQNLVVLGNISGEIPNSFKINNWSNLYVAEAATRYTITNFTNNYDTRTDRFENENFTARLALGSVTESQISDLQTYLTSYTETDPTFTTWLYTFVDANTQLSEGEVDTFVSNNGYLTSYTETDPVFIASGVFGVTTGDVINWDTAYGWGDHSLIGYLTSEVNPTNTTIYIPESQITDLYHFINADETDQVFVAWDKTTGISILETQISDLIHTVDTNTQLDETTVDAFVANNGYLISFTETDPIFLAMNTLAELNTQLGGLSIADGAHTINTNTQLSQDDVRGFENNPTNSTFLITTGQVNGLADFVVANEINPTNATIEITEIQISDLVHTVNTDTQLNQAGVEALGFVTGVHTNVYDDTPVTLNTNTISDLGTELVTSEVRTSAVSGTLHLQQNADSSGRVRFFMNTTGNPMVNFWGYDSTDTTQKYLSIWLWDNPIVTEAGTGTLRAIISSGGNTAGTRNALELQSPDQIRITSVDNVLQLGSVRIAADTSIKIHPRTVAETDAAKHLIIDTTGGVRADGTDVELSTNAGDLVLNPAGDVLVKGGVTKTCTSDIVVVGGIITACS